MCAAHGREAGPKPASEEASKVLYIGAVPGTLFIYFLISLLSILPRDVLLLVILSS